MKIADITDGVAYTIMVSEKSLDPDLLIFKNQGGNQQDGDTFGFTAGFDKFDTTRHGAKVPLRDASGNTSYDAFGSAHLSSVNALMCDGSVKQIGFAINNTLPASNNATLRAINGTSVPATMTLMQRLCGRAESTSISATDIDQ